MYESSFAGDNTLLTYRYESGTAADFGDRCSTLEGFSSGSAPFTVRATVVDTPPGFAMIFVPDTIQQGSTSTLTFTIDNSDKNVGVTDLAFASSLLPGLVLVDSPSTGNSCGGTLTAPAGGTEITFFGGSVAARATCEVSVTVRGAEIGEYISTTTDLTSSIATAGGVRARLLVRTDAPGFTKAFSPDTVDLGTLSRLTYTIDNSRNEVDLGSLAFVDDFPVSLDVASIPNVSTTCGGTFNFDGISGTSAVQFSGGLVRAKQTCTISVEMRGLQFTLSRGDGVIESVSSDLTSDLAAPAPGARARLTINDAPLNALMSFSPATIMPGQISRLTYRLRNDTAIRASGIFLLDTLPADVVVADVPDASTTCIGDSVSLEARAGGDEIILAGVGEPRLGAGQVCTVAVDVTSAVPGSYLNVADIILSSHGVSTAEATLTVLNTLGFTKTFSPATVDPGEVSTLTFTIDGAAAISASSLAFTDAFPDGMIVADPPSGSNTCGGTFAPAASDNLLTFTGGRIAARQSCTISVDVQALRSGILENISGDLTSDLPEVTPGVAATLMVNEAPLSVSMAFESPAITQGGVSRLTYGLDNSAAVAATSVALSDTLPADVEVTSNPNASTTCTDGTLTAVAGTGSITFMGGVLAAGATCTIAVDVTSAIPGSYRNRTETVTSSLGASTSASAMLTVNAADAPVFTKTFSPTSVDPGGISTLTFTIDNTANAIVVGSLAFTDVFPDGMTVADPPRGSTTCGGTFTPVASDNSLVFTGGRVAAGESCTVTVGVQAQRPSVLGNIPGDLTPGGPGMPGDLTPGEPAIPGDLTPGGPGVPGDLTPDLPGTTPGAGATCTTAVDGSVLPSGTLTNRSGELSSDLPVVTPGAEATLTVNEAPLLVAVAFEPARITVGDVSTLTYRFRNDAAVAAAMVCFPSFLLPTGVEFADPLIMTDTCSSPIDPATECAITVDVTSTVPGSYLHSVEDVSSSLGTSAAASATLTVTAADAPVFAKAFSPATVDPGEISTLTFTIDNGANTIEVTTMAFTDAFPAGMAVADLPNASTTCGGTFAPVAGEASLAFTGGSVAARESCTLSVDVQARRPGVLTNRSGDLTSNLSMATPGAAATLAVNEVPLTVLMAFEPATISQGGVSTLTYELGNGALVEATAVSLSDMLPADLVVVDAPGASTTCADGTLAVAGGDTITFTGGTLGLGETCTIAVDVTSTVAGSYPNNTETVASSLGTSTAAEATLTVTTARAPIFARIFSPDTIRQGGETEIIFTVDNSVNAIGMMEMAFDDTLPSGVSVADPPGIINRCGGTFSPIAGATTLALTGGSLAASATCEIRVMVRALEAGTRIAPNVDLTSSIAMATAAEATLIVNPADAPGFTKAFEPAAVDPGGVSTLTFAINNSDNLIDIGSLAFTDAFPDGMAVADPPNASTTCGGTFAPAAGEVSLAFTDGSVAAGATCTIGVDVQALRSGMLENTSGELSSDLPVATPGASATLMVNEASLSVSMAFEPTEIAQGGVSRLTYGLDNGATVAAMSVVLFDMLPTGILVASDPNVMTTCTGGTLAAGAGSDTITFTGRTLGLGETCMIAVDVTSTVAGSYANSTESVISSLGTSAAAEATLTVTAADAPGFAKAFSTMTVDPGGVSTLTFTIDNSDNLIEIGSLAFTDAFPDGMAVADPPNASTTCGGTFAPAAGEVSLAFTDGSVAAGATCTVGVDVQALRSGMLENTSGELSSDLPVATPGAVATLAVNDAPLSVTLSFDPATIRQGGVSRLTYSLGNGVTAGASEVSLSDTLPANVIVASTPDAQTTCTGGTVAATAGGSTITYTGGTVDASGACTIMVDVTSATPGSYPNSTERVISSLGTSAAAEATLIVNPADAPGFAKVFDPATVDPGGVSTLTFTIDNSDNLIDIGSLAFTDAFPEGMAVADSPNAETTCGGTFAPAASAPSLAFTGGSVAAGQSCTLSVEVQALRSGMLENTSGELSSDLPVATPGAVATLAVNDAPLSVTLSFDPATIRQGGVSRLTYSLGNGVTAGASEVSLSDTLPANVIVASTPDAQTTCTGGTVAATADGSTITYSGGTVDAGGACTIMVDVTSATPGSYPNSTERVISSLGTSAAASATLMVDAADAPIFTKTFVSDPIDQGEETEIVFRIDNSGNAIEVTTMAFTDPLPAGLVVATVPGINNSCGGTFAAPAGATTLAFTGGALAAGATCEVRVTARAIGAGMLTNPAINLTSSIATATSAEATLIVDPADAPGFAKAFLPATVDPGGVSTLTLTIDNGVNALEVESLAFTDAFPDGMTVADPPNAETTCGGTFAPAAGETSLAFTGGNVAAGATCTVAVKVQALRSGMLENTSGELSSDLPVTTPGAAATLSVNDAPLSVTMMFDFATIRQGGVSRLTYGLDNGATVSVSEVSLSDTLPVDVVVASDPNVMTTCTGGVVAASTGGRMITYSGGSLDASTDCTIMVDVTSATPGSYPNSTESVISSLGTSAAAEATLIVNPADALGFAKAFSPATVDPGGVSTLTFTINNGANAIEVTTMAFTDAFPDGLVVAGTPNVQNDCGGTFAPAASASSLTFSGGSVAAGQSCTLSVEVQALRSGALTNRSGELTSELPVATPGASATLTVNEAPPSVTLSFDPATIRQGGVSRLTYGLGNGAAVGASEVALSDTLPANVVVAFAPDAQTTCTGDTVEAMAGGNTITYTGGTVDAGGTCTIMVDVTSAVAGSYSNSTESVASSLGASTAASATLTVTAADAPVFTKAFLPATVDPGEVSTLTFTIDNGANAIEVTTMAFTDAFPDGMTVADPPSASTTCGGTFAPAVGETSLAFTGGSVAVGQSCTLSVEVQALRPGALVNTSDDLTSDLPVTTAGASATLTVNEAPLTVSMMFDLATIRQGDVSTLTYALGNGALVGASEVSLSDMLPADLVVADAPGASTTCAGGTLTAAAGGDRITYTGGTVDAGGACTIMVDVTSAVAGSYSNSTESVISSLGTGTAASATLTVTAADAPVFTKAFLPATVDPGEVSTLTFTINNGANAIEVTTMAFTDAFPDGLVVAGTPNVQNDCGGTFAPAASASSLTFSGGSVAAGQSCTLSVEVQALRSGALVNISDDLTSDLPVTTAGASATLTVNEAPLTVSMMFDLATIRQGDVSTLTYALGNGALVGASEVSLSDMLPADLVVADAPGASTTCAGGTLMAAAGGDRITYTGGTVDAGGACTIMVDVTSAVAGSYSNSTESVASSLGASTAASATLTVTAADAPVFTKAFLPATVDPGEVSTLTFTIDNGANAIEVTTMAFTDAFPDGLVVAGTPNVQNDCGGTFVPAASASSLTFSGGSVAAGQSCTLSVEVQALRSGALTNRSGELTSDLPVATPGASATLTVNEAPLTISMMFDLATIRQGGVSRLTYGLGNGAAVGASEVSLSDTLPANVVVASAPDARTTCAGGTLMAAAGGDRITYTGGTVDAGGACTIMVDVTSAVAGSYSNSTESVASSLGASTAASATLTVTAADAPVFTKAFLPATVDPGEVSTLTFTIDNGANAIEVTTMAFTDAFPDGLVVAGTPNVQNDCGGTFVPAASASSLTFSGGSVAAGQSCTLSVEVQALRSGALTNRSGELTSDLPVATPGASATLTVNEAPLTISMMFDLATIRQGGVSRLTYGLGNGAAAGASEVSLSDTLPANVVVASAPDARTTCAGGTLMAAAGGDRITYTGGTVDAGGACTIMVDVTSAVAGSYSNSTESVASSLGASTAASATLTVTAADAPVFTKAFLPATVDPGEVSTLTFTIDNGANAIEVTTMAFTDAFPDGLVVAGTPNVQNDCGGTFVPAASASSLTFSGGSVAAGQSCTLSVEVQALRSGALTNRSGELTSDLPVATPGASATLTVNEAPLTISMMFDLATIRQGGVSTLTYALGNGALVGASEVSLSDMLPADLVVADAPGASTTCAGGTLMAAAGGDRITYTGGTVDAGGACTIMVDVTSAVAGSYSNSTESVISSLGTGTAASATLTVTAADAPVFTKAFLPATVDPGEVSTLTFTINNGANAIEVTTMAFTDAFPDGLVVAGTPNVQNDCGGTFVPAASASSLTFSGGSVAAGQSCTLSVEVQALRSGALTNRSGELTSDLPVATPGASATLTVNEAPLTISMMFDLATIRQGGVSILTYALGNGALVGASEVSLSDMLPADLVVADAPGASTTCAGGTLMAAAGGDRITYTGGTVDAGGACTIMVDVTSAVAGSYSNSTESVISSLGTGTAASATLTVTAADAPVFTKAFLPATVDPGEVSTLTFTINNGANAIEVTTMAFTDAFPDGLVVAGTPNVQNDCGGTFAPAASAPSLTFSGGSVAAGQSCTLSVEVQALRSGALANRSGELTSDLPVATPGASATLTVNEAPLTISMMFDLATIRQGDVSRLTYGLGNGAAVGASEVALSDMLPADLVVADAPGASTTCAGGTLMAAAGGDRITYTGGTVDAGGACTIMVDVTSAVAGSYSNSTESVASSLGASTAASATLTVTAADAPVFTKAFLPATVDPGEVSTLTFTIDNGANAIEVTTMAFTDAFPDGLVVAGTPNVQNDCGGTFAPAASASSLTFSGGSVAAGQSCTLSVEVQALRSGALTNRSGELTSELPVATPGASATLTVNEAPPSVTLSFDPATIRQGGVSRLTYGLGNGAAVGASEVALSDTLPANVVVASAPDARTTCTGGTVEATADGNTITYTGGTVDAGGACTIMVDVTSATPGSYPNSTESVISSLGTSTAASATLTVNPADAPGFAKVFEPATVDPGGVSTLTFTIDNSDNLVDIGSLAFTDAFPTGMAVANPPTAETTCGGTFAPAASAPSLAFTGGSVAAGQSCTLSVAVQALRSGALANRSGELTSDLPVATPGASATLTVNEAPPSVTLSFDPATIRQGGVSRLTYGLGNGAAVGASEVALSDTLPANVVVASAPDARTTCTGGTVEATAGGNTITYTGGTVDAGGACTIMVDVTSATPGSYPNSTESVISSLGTSTAASATLMVNPADAPGFAKVFEPATVDPGGVSTLTFTIDNSDNLVDIGSLAFTDAFPDGLVVAGTPNVQNDCGGTFAPAASASSLTFSGGSVAAGQSCTLSVEVQALRPGALTNRSGDLTSDLPAATPGASATLTVNKAPLSVSISFVSAVIDLSRVSTLTYELGNGAVVEASEVSLSDMLPADLVVADAQGASTTCAGGTLTAGGDRITYTGGTVDAGGACTVTVDVTSATSGRYANSTETVISSLGTSTPAQATLIVNPADALGFTKAFSPTTVAPGEISTLTFTIDNGANAIEVTTMAFTDAFPDGLVVAGTPNVQNDCGGTFAPAASAPSLTFSGGSVAAGQSCTLSVEVQALRPGALTNRSGDLTSDLPVATPGASATLTVNEAPLTVSMMFDLATIRQGDVSTLTYALGNGALVGASEVSLSDMLPADLVVADAPGASTTCAGGTLTAAAGGDRITYTGGTVDAGGACTIMVDVTSAVAGSYSNSTETVASSLGASTAASATLTVTAADAPVFTKAFLPATVDPGEVSTLTFTINNGANAIEVTTMAFTDAFPDGMTVADPPSASTTCGGTFAPAVGETSLAFTGGSVAVGQSCTLSVEVQALRPGALVNTSDDLTSDLPVTTAGASATLTVNEAPLSVSMMFDLATIRQGGVSTLTYELDNGAAIAATSVALSDTLPADVVVADPPDAQTTCSGGMLIAAADGDMINFTDGMLAPGAVCTISVDVTSATPGSYPNSTESVISSLGTSTLAQATLIVNPADALGFAKAFSPTTVAPGGVSTLTFTINNGANALKVGSLAFTDAFPNGLVVADPTTAETTCGGTFALAAGADSIAFTGGSIAAGQSCMVAVAVQALRSGMLENISGELTSDLPVATPGAAATLAVNEVPLSVSMMFEPATIRQGGVSRLTYGLGNGAAVGASEVALSDTLPAEIVVASIPNAQTTCTGGTVGATAGGNTITYTGGTVGAGGACTITVDVTSAIPGSYLNDMVGVTSSLGTSDAAEATLIVNPADALGFAKVFEPATVDPGGVSTLTFTIDNMANRIAVGTLSFVDDFPDGLVVAAQPNVSTTCGGTVVAPTGGRRFTHTGGTVDAGRTCTIAVDVQALRSGMLENTSGELSSDLPVTTPGAEATLTVNEVPLSVSMMFEPTTIDQGGVSRLTYGLDNGAAVGASEVSLSDTLPAEIVVASIPNAQTTCTGGMVAAPPGGRMITYSGGSLDASTDCTIMVDVTSATPGSYPNSTESVISSLGTSTAASATLMVNPADAPGFAKAFSPATVDPGGVSTLTFTINNGANAIEVTTMAFTDSFPEGLVVADSSNASTTCGGTFAPAAGATSLAFAGGSVAAGATCMVAVDVRPLRSGTLTNTSGELTSDLPVTTPGAEATLTVHEAPLSVSMSFDPATIDQGRVSTLTYELGNRATVAAMSVALSDTLPAEIVVASPSNASTTCPSGTLTAVASGTSIEYSGGTVDADRSCTVTVAVTSTMPGMYQNSTESVTSALGISAPASATLIVEEAEAGTVTFNVESDIDGTFGFSASEPGLATSLAVSDGTGSTGALPVAAGSHAVAVAGPRGAVLAAIDCDDTDSTADVSAETISLVVDALEDITCTITVQSSISEAIKTINSFLTRRADLVLSSEPDPQRRFDRLKDGSGNASRLSLSGEDLKAFSLFTAQGSRGDYQASTSLLQTRQAAASATLARNSSIRDAAYVENYQFDAWFDGQYKEFDDGASGDGYFAIAYAGADYLLTPDVLVGAVVSFDSMEEKTDTSTASGFGWMVGPQLTARLGSRLYFDGRIAAGRSENRVSPFNTYTDDFWTWRWLSSASLTGEFQYDNWTIRPHASLSYFEERQKSYVDSLGAEIPGQTVRLGQLKLGPTFTGRFESAEGPTYSPYLTIDAIYNIGDTTGVTLLEPDRPEIEGWRGNLEAGFSAATDNGSRLSLGASYDGIGQPDFETWGLTFELSIPLGKSRTR